MEPEKSIDSSNQWLKSVARTRIGPAVIGTVRSLFLFTLALEHAWNRPEHLIVFGLGLMILAASLRAFENRRHINIADGKFWLRRETLGTGPWVGGCEDITNFVAVTLRRESIAVMPAGWSRYGIELTHPESRRSLRLHDRLGGARARIVSRNLAKETGLPHLGIRSEMRDLHDIRKTGQRRLCLRLDFVFRFFRPHMASPNMPRTPTTIIGKIAVNEAPPVVLPSW